MSSKPVKANLGPTPVSGTQAAPVNAIFAGPNGDGLLQDVPPLVTLGTEGAPLIVINGNNQTKLGLPGPQSPKTHG